MRAVDASLALVAKYRTRRCRWRSGTSIVLTSFGLGSSLTFSVLPWPLITTFVLAHAFSLVVGLIVVIIFLQSLFLAKRLLTRRAIEKIASKVLRERDINSIIYSSRKSAFVLRSVTMRSDGLVSLEFKVLDYCQHEQCLTRSSNSQSLVPPRALRPRRSYLAECLPAILRIDHDEVAQVSPSSDYYFLISNQHRAWALRNRVKDSISDLRSRIKFASESKVKYEGLAYMPYASESIERLIFAAKESLLKAEESLSKVEKTVEFLTMRIESIEDFGVELREMNQDLIQERVEINSDLNGLLVACEEIELLRESLS